MLVFATHREHRGLRTITGVGVSVTRGAAQAQLFCYALTLLTMCRNSITFLRSTYIGRAFPLQHYREFHQICAWTGIFFTVVHVAGHIVNFYNISTQPADDNRCYFRDVYQYSHELQSYYYWLYVTPTGFSGVLLVVQLMFIGVFSTKLIRKYSYEAFWAIRKLFLKSFIPFCAIVLISFLFSRSIPLVVLLDDDCSWCSPNCTTSSLLVLFAIPDSALQI
jgi:dual oxidase